jgi:hypothetical protein
MRLGLRENLCCDQSNKRLVDAAATKITAGVIAWKSFMLSGAPMSEILSASIFDMGIRPRIDNWTFYLSSNAAMPVVH